MISATDQPLFVSVNLIPIADGHNTEDQTIAVLTRWATAVYQFSASGVSLYGFLQTSYCPRAQRRKT